MTFVQRMAVLLVVMALATASAQAVPIASDSFLIGDPPDPSAGEYSFTPPANNGRLTLAPGPQNPTVAGFSGAWGGSGTSLWQVIDAGLTHPSQPDAAGGAVQFMWPSEVGDRTVSRSLSSIPAQGAGATFWMSALMSLNENDPDFDGYALVGFTQNASPTDVGTNGLRLGFQGDGGEMDLIYRSRTRLAPPGGPVTLEDNVILNGVTPGDTHLVVLKAQQDVAGPSPAPNDAISIWLDPPSAGNEGQLGAPTITLSDFSLFDNSFQNLIFQGSNITGAGAVFDEPRLGRSLGDVLAAPEGQRSISFQEGVSPIPGYEADAVFVRLDQANANHDFRDQIIVGPNNTGGPLRGLLEFDLTELKNQIAGQPVTIDDVQLILHTHSSAGAGGVMGVDVLALGEDFDETTVTWNSLTPPGGDLGAPLLTSATLNPADTGVDVMFGWTPQFGDEVLNALMRDDMTLRMLLVRSGGDPTNIQNFARFDDNEASILGNRPELFISFRAQEVPEPMTAGLLGLGAFVLLRRRQRA